MSASRFLTGRRMAARGRMSTLLVRAAACCCLVQAVAPAPGRDTSPTSGSVAGGDGSMSRLEALVGALYNLQSSRSVASEDRREATESDSVLILDDTTSRDALESRCMCEMYAGSASARSGSLCGWEELGKIVCWVSNTSCPSNMVPCSGAPAEDSLELRVGSAAARELQASPGPSSRVSSAEAFIDAETELTQYLNVEFQLSASGALPEQASLTKELARELDVPTDKITLKMTVNTAGVGNLRGKAAVVRATVVPNDLAKAEHTLKNMKRMHIDGDRVTIHQVSYGSSEHALICDSTVEILKREAFDLFSRYLDLKSKELDLLSSLARDASRSSTSCSSCAPVQLFAEQLGIGR